MKKFIMMLVLCTIGVATTVNAQISITGSGSVKASSYIAKDMYGHVTRNGDSFVICVKDNASKGTLTVRLGDNPCDALASLTSLSEAFENLKNKEYITFNDGNNDITMYKYSNQPYFTDGDAEYAKNYLRESMKSAMLGGITKRNRESDCKIGMIKKHTLFNVALNEISILAELYK